jgi:hypothetical protein
VSSKGYDHLVAGTCRTAIDLYIRPSSQLVGMTPAWIQMVNLRSFFYEGK